MIEVKNTQVLNEPIVEDITSYDIPPLQEYNLVTGKWEIPVFIETFELN